MLIGTLGRSSGFAGRFRHEALFDIAAAGLIAGFLVACRLSPVSQRTVLPVTTAPHGLALGPPLSSLFFEHLLRERPASSRADLRCVPVGMLVTSMNLFLGQLDGGHALFALFPGAHRVVSWLTIGALALPVAVQSVVLRTLRLHPLARHPARIERSPSSAPRRDRTAGLGCIALAAAPR
jgi:hypothetical protein